MICNHESPVSAGLSDSVSLPDFDRRFVHEAGVRFCVGMDEAGRGPLAGPLAVAVYVFDTFSGVVDGVHDSKKLSVKKRESVYHALMKEPFYARCILVEPEEIDKVNIYRATQYAMEKLLYELPTEVSESCVCITDAMPIRTATMRVYPLVKADASSYAVAAASVIAKVTRDAAMKELAQLYPDYGFERHKGYPTAEHCAVIRRLGPTPVHRMSFSPVREMLQSPTKELFTDE